MQADPLVKFVADVRSFGFDFKNFAELIAGQTITSSSISFAPASGLVCTPTAVSGTVVSSVISAGLPSTVYTLFVNANTSGGATIQAQQLLNVLP